MVMLVRCDGEDEEDDGDDGGSERLLKGLTHQCSLTLHVQGLPTGYCKDIHGQVCAYKSNIVRPNLVSFKAQKSKVHVPSVKCPKCHTTHTQS